MKAAPVAAAALCAAIAAVLQTELVLNIGYFVDCDQPVVVVELADCRKVLVLLFFDRAATRIGVSDREFGAISLENTLKAPAIDCYYSSLIVSFLFLFNRLLLNVNDAS